jgi:hypothetical protein
MKYSFVSAKRGVIPDINLKTLKYLLIYNLVNIHRKLPIFNQIMIQIKISQTLHNFLGISTRL